MDYSFKDYIIHFLASVCIYQYGVISLPKPIKVEQTPYVWENVTNNFESVKQGAVTHWIIIFSIIVVVNFIIWFLNKLSKK